MSIFNTGVKRNQTGEFKDEILKQEICYNNDEDFFDIVDTKYKGVRYVIINRGKHPCAYVECEKEFIDKYWDENNYEMKCDISVHGDVTYCGRFDDLRGCQGMEGYCFGWDYAHAGDWAGYLTDEQNGNARKYTVGMIVDECKNAIDQYLKVIEEAFVEYFIKYINE